MSRPESAREDEFRARKEVIDYGIARDISKFKSELELKSKSGSKPEEFRLHNISVISSTFPLDEQLILGGFDLTKKDGYDLFTVSKDQTNEHACAVIISRKDKKIYYIDPKADKIENILKTPLLRLLPGYNIISNRTQQQKDDDKDNILIYAVRSKNVKIVQIIIDAILVKSKDEKLGESDVLLEMINAKNGDDENAIDIAAQQREEWEDEAEKQEETTTPEKEIEELILKYAKPGLVVEDSEAATIKSHEEKQKS